MKRTCFLLVCYCYALTLRGQHVEYAPLYNAGTFDAHTIDISKPVGATPGAADVSPAGAAAYSIPVAIPPGTNGVMPSVSLEYNSLSGAGIAGMGWSLSGLSVIARVPQNMYFDGLVRPVQLNADDRFALDGQRMLIKAGTYGGNGSVYGTEAESFAAVTIKDMLGSSPKWFEVVSKDGIRMQYGNTSDSRFMNEDNTSVIFWMLNRMVYPDGNYIEYEYSASEREPRIERILYTGNAEAGLSPFNEISFEYKVRQSSSFSDIRTVYIGGAALVSRFLLDKIVVKGEGNITRSYQLAYGNDGVNSYLNSVQESSGEGITLNPTVFKYGEKPQLSSMSTSVIPSGNSFRSASGDYDGDGSADILTVSGTERNGTWIVNQFRTWKRNPVNATYSVMATQNIPQTSTYTYFGTSIPGIKQPFESDFNGDGMSDVSVFALQYQVVQQFTRLDHILHYVSNPGGASFSSHQQPPPAKNGDLYNGIQNTGSFVFQGDFDGNGLTDQVFILGRAIDNSDPTTFYYDNQGGTAYAYSEVMSFIPFNGQTRNAWWLAKEHQVIDFNGDGRQDLVLFWDDWVEIFTFDSPTRVRSVYNSSAFPISTTYNTIRFGDFNGDGKMDVLVCDPDFSNIIKGTSTGAGFVQTPVNIVPHWAAYHTNEFNNGYLSLGDFNGDGRSDIHFYWERNRFSPHDDLPHPNPYTRGLDIYYSTGDGFVNQQVEIAHDNYNYISGRSIYVSPYYHFPVDMNGDGRTDIINERSNTLEVRYYNPEGDDNLMVKLKDGFDKLTEWSYRRMTAAGIYSKGTVPSSYPVNVIVPGINAVSACRTSNSAGGQNEASFTYEGAINHRAGKGFLGFIKTTVTDQSMGTATVQEKGLNTTYFTLVPKKTTIRTTSSYVLIAETVFVHELVSAGGKRFLVKTGSIAQNDNIRGVITTTNNTYDSYGNIVSGTVTIPGVHTTQTNTVYQAFPGSIPNKPTSMTVTSTRSGQPAYSVTTSYGYNSKGQLTARTDFSGMEKQVTTTYGYNNLGNVISTSVSSPGIATRSTSAVYDGKGRYAESTVDEMGYGTATGYDPKWGVPLSTTDLQGVTTSYEYDPFGRLKKTSFPGGYSRDITYHWAVSGSRRWYVQSSAPGHPAGKTWYDLLGREVRSETELFDGTWSVQSKTYDARGNVHTTTGPHKDGESYTTTSQSYDVYNRLSEINNGVSGNTTLAYIVTGGNLTVTTNTPSGTTSQTTDPAGMLISATDGGGTLTYAYYSHGGLKAVSNGSTNLVTSEYDACGRQTRLIDLNAGTTEYRYDALGQLVWQKNAKGQETSIQYNMAGQMTSRSGPEGITSYSYGTSNSGNDKRGLVKTVSGFAGNSSSYQYNALGMLAHLTENNDGIHTTSYTYNTAGKISSMIYPSGLVITYEYNTRGYLSKIRQGGQDLYATNTVNGKGQVTGYSKGNGKASSVDYAHGFPTRYYTNGVQDLRLSWNYQTGNLSSREDARNGKNESFSYDNLNRLTGANVSGGTSVSTGYTPGGNISVKADAGSYSYHLGKIHAVEEVTNAMPSPVPLLSQEITYTAFMQPQTISENNDVLTYDYGVDYNRIKSELRQGGSVIRTRYYFEAGFEKDITGGASRYIQYISGPVGLIAIIESVGGNHHKHYTYTDHLASILVATDESGAIEAEQSFDAWGRRRDAASWVPLSPVAATGLPLWIYRGYTGHEHLDQFGLINMNGRMYDPVLGRMLSLDNYVPDPLFSQDYNRYTYARNNPLVYTDPDGEFWHIVIGAALGGGINLGIQAALGNVNSFKTGLMAFGQGALIGGMAAMGCASCSVGSLALGSALAVGNSYIPAYSIPLGSSGFSVSLGLSVGFGSTGSFAGVNMGLNYSSEYFSAGFSYGAGYHFRDNIAGKPGWSQSYGGGAIVGGNDFRVGMFTNQFEGRELDQRTGTFYLETNGWSVAYENDWMFGVPISDGGDRFRTTGVRISKGDFSVGLNLFTGDPGLRFNDRAMDGGDKDTGFMGTYREELTPKHRLGAIYGGYKGFRAGWNSEKIRNVFQNNLAHGRGYTHPLFEVLKVKGAPYINYYQTRNRFTTWY